MECRTMSTSQGLLSGQHGNKHIWWFLSPNRIPNFANIHGLQVCMKHSIRGILCLPTTLEEQFSSMQSNNYSESDEYSSGDVPEQSAKLKSLLADAERAKLLKKLSEANQHNRYLKRQLLVREEAFAQFKSELAFTELEIQALLNMAKEMASYGIPAGSRKIHPISSSFTITRCPREIKETNKRRGTCTI